MSETRVLTPDNLPKLSAYEAKGVNTAASKIESGDVGPLVWGKKLIVTNRRIGRLIVEDHRLAMQYADPNYVYQDVEAHYDGIMNGYLAICSYMSMVGFLRSGLDLPRKYLRQLKRDRFEMPVADSAQLDRVRRVRGGEAPLEESVKEGWDIIDSSELADNRAKAYLAMTPPLDRVLDATAKRFGFLHDQHVDSFADGFGLGYENALEMYVQSREEALMPEF